MSKASKRRMMLTRGPNDQSGARVSIDTSDVPPVASLTRLYSRVRRSERESELVLFDANRRAGMSDLLDPRPRAVEEALTIRR